MPNEIDFPGPGDEAASEQRRERRRDSGRERVVRQRRLTAVLVLAGLAFLIGIIAGAGGDGGNGGSDVASAKEELPTLPGGGRRIFPDRRVVAFYGAPQDDELGVLGIGDPMKVGAKLDKQAAPYGTPKRKVLPAMELIVTIAANAPGSDGLYRTRQHETIIRQYLKAARAAGAILVLDIQPGRANFLDETKALEKWLKEPDVSLALDPEWHMKDGGIPGQSIGSVTGQEINEVSTWLSDLTRRNRLPEKLLVVHRFTEEMIEQPETIEQPPGVAITLNVDGFGTKEAKVAKYRDLVPRQTNAGFKLFYREDEGLMKPKDVLALKPQPDLIVYE